MKTILLINPYSKGGKSKILAQKAIDYLNKNKFKFDVEYIKKFDEAIILSRKANLDGYDNIIALGGDGTINNVINGFFDNEGNRISKARFGVIYTGTSPDFCKSYSIPTKIEDACDVIMSGNSIKIPVGKIDYKSNKEINIREIFNTTSYFVCCANIGLGATLAQNANSGIRKYLGDFLGTFVSLIKTLLMFQSSNIKLNIDNTTAIFTNSLNISIGITKFIASGIKVDTAKKHPEEFYFIRMKKAPLFKMMEVIYRIYSGKIKTNDNYLSITSCKKIEFKCENSIVDVEFDGDPHGILPCRIEFAKEQLDLIC